MMVHAGISQRASDNSCCTARSFENMERHEVNPMNVIAPNTIPHKQVVHMPTLVTNLAPVAFPAPRAFAMWIPVASPMHIPSVQTISRILISKENAA
eukprot:CAMPEP_0180656272 /NCGR_PEP_ID=MMETSP1037_2-20121125/55758_1 /TAXON_ID=632150 /ORGANISM="Azadinium spinosum, Strain 3D9" /LENGTH=96 /DNA_ID=CAMNT_0022682833 /DNA_START=252 /DNA_END=538 /DNA_ORIENTATION=+